MVEQKHYRVFTYPHGVRFDSSQGTKGEELQEAPTTGIAPDAMINSGPCEANGNPNQITVGAGRRSPWCSEHDESSGARSCRRSTPETR